jgi:O-antigen/teichoic acid export membrane protein
MVGVEAFGPVAVLTAYTVLFPALTTQPVGLVITQEISAAHDQPRVIQKIITRMLCISLCWAVSIVLLLLMLWHMELLAHIPGLGSPHLSGLIIITGFFMCLNILFQAILNGLDKVVSSAALSAISGVLIGCVFVGAAIILDVRLVLWGSLVIIGLTTTAGAVHVWRTVTKLSSDNTAYVLPESASSNWARLIRQTALSLISSLAVVPVTYICADMLHAQKNGEEQYTVFVLFEQLVSIVSYLPVLFAQASLPVLSRSLVKDPYYGSLVYLKSVLPLTAIVSITVFLVGILCLPLLPIVYGSDFLAYLPAAQWALAYAALMIPLASLGAAVQARGRFLECALLNGGWAVMFFLFSIVWIQKTGLTGFQVARFSSSVILMLSLLIFFVRVIKKPNAV